MRRVFKYTFKKGKQSVEVPFNAKFVSTGVQNGEFVAWADVPNDASATMWREFAVVPTGGRVPATGQFIGTMQRNEGSVWHLFEVL